MHHFYLTLPSGEVRPLSAPFLPRAGDSIHIDGIEIRIDRVTWVSNGSSLADEPILHGDGANQVHLNHTIGTDHRSLARQIAQRQPDKIIAAIKDLRAATGIGLKEAKDIMDATYRELGYR